MEEKLDRHRHDGGVFSRAAGTECQASVPDDSKPTTRLDRGEFVYVVPAIPGPFAPRLDSPIDKRQAAKLEPSQQGRTLSR